MFWFLGQQACGILALWPGIELTSPALEGKVLTSEPPGKSYIYIYIYYHKTKNQYIENPNCDNWI